MRLIAAVGAMKEQLTEGESRERLGAGTVLERFLDVNGKV